MRQIRMKHGLGVAGVCFALIVGGCMSIPNSPTPRFYALSAVNENQVTKRINMSPGVLIGIGPVKIPEYLDRPQMVTKENQGTLKFDEFDRWGESLDVGIARLIR